ncbi:MAG: hypothetical protein Q9195_004271 [Heterodermia aff. obscurata]
MKEATGDIERNEEQDDTFMNTTVRALTWKNLHVEATASRSSPLTILSEVDGLVSAGEMLALMGPSGSGKTTLLNSLAQRNGKKMKSRGTVAINGFHASRAVLQDVSSYVEQEDALIGSLTVRETMDFAARLSLPRSNRASRPENLTNLGSSVNAQERARRVNELIVAFGLQNQAETIVGTPIRKGLSGGQKRRLSIASQLITAPKILFLDEPTSGLDSTASYEVMKYLRNAVRKNRLIVIASIHQPSTSTFELFDKLLLLSQGQVCYNGSISLVKPYLEARNNPMPLYVNPAEFLLDWTSSDFAGGDDTVQEKLNKIHADWKVSDEASTLIATIPENLEDKDRSSLLPASGKRATSFQVIIALIYRSFIKSYRDVVAYGIRFAMYTGLAVMMGTVWLQLPPTDSRQASIQPFINAIFFGSAFMSFMAVAYVPAFLEDRATFIKERANGLYVLISLLFSIITYFLINLRPGGSAFFTWVMWLFLDLLAGESLVVLMSSIFPNFVISLALTAFANGLWMSVGGFLVSPTILNPFWKYVFHYIDYQSYVFQGMMVNEFGHRTYDCGSGCSFGSMIPTWSSTAATAYITYPPASLLDVFPPSPEPTALAPPLSDRTFARPFDIDHDLYNELLNVQWPLTIAAVYAVVVYILNNSNRQHQNKPWAISKSPLFYIFVLLHNIFLAAFSFWTFFGMINAIRQAWPGFEGDQKWAAAADALCKVNGPRGLGSAATFNAASNTWGFTDSAMKLLDNAPDSTDVGRLWNEGLGFYGWLFYVSKFYEVIDTLIILAKGKNSSVLQTFHHAGAMMCMWAGIRYMSPPIWMFVFINSGLHGLMYVYYTLSTIDVKIPMGLKRVLTSLQIIQFIFGASYAIAHLFVAYDIPVSVPYSFIHNLSSALPSAASSVSSAAASATVTAGLQSWLKKAALRAAGEEGLAMNVRNDQGEAFGIDALHAAESEKAQEEIHYRLEYQRINCLDTSGQVFAILLNAVYLAPLTILFLQFFVNNYVLGTKKYVPPASRLEIAQQAAKDAVRELEQAIKEAVENESHNDEIEIPPEVKASIDKAKSHLKHAKAKAEEATQKPRAQAGETAEKIQQITEAAQEEATDVASKARTELLQALATVREKGQNGIAKAQEKGADLKDEAAKKFSEAKDRATGKAEEVKEEAEDTGEEKVKDEADEEEEDVAIKHDEAEPKADVKDEPEPKAATATENAKPKEQPKSKIPKRDKSPVKRDPSPVKSDPKPKANSNDGKSNGEGGAAEPNGLDESAYEINPDELKDEAEKEAERELQPGN